MAIKNILTVDVEDWFHICGVEKWLPKAKWPELENRVAVNTLKILEILDRKTTKATFFVLGFVAERSPNLIREIREEGHEIATHGYAHERVYAMTPRAFRNDLCRAVGIISEITGHPVRGYRAPEWSIRDDSFWALDILCQEGFAYDSSMTPLHIVGNQKYSRVPHRLYLDRGELWEFPPLVAVTSIVNLPLGGGWGLRVFPYQFIRSSIRKLNQQSQPALIFLHPREFDSDTPRISLPWIKRFVLHAEVESTQKRLERLLDDFLFSSVNEVLGSCRL